jgi:3-dehydroquinate dehydratase-1
VLFVTRLAESSLRLGKLTLAPCVPIVIAPFTDRTPLATLARAARQGLDLFEARVDLFRHPAAATTARHLRAARKLLPLLLTVRSASEGGAFDRDEDARLALFTALLPQADAVDVELAAPIRRDVVSAAQKAKRLVVLSHHDFEHTPSERDLDRVVTRGFDAGADIVKIAVKVAGDDEVARLAALFTLYKERPLVIIGMGEHGLKTRLLFPALGSRFTFASLDRATAPGQLDLRATQRHLSLLYPDYAARLAKLSKPRAKARSPRARAKRSGT